MTQAEAAVAKETPAHAQRTNKTSCIAAVCVANVSSCAAAFGLPALLPLARFHRDAIYSANPASRLG